MFKIKVLKFLFWKLSLIFLVYNSIYICTLYSLLPYSFFVYISLYDNMWIKDPWGQILHVTSVYPRHQYTTRHRLKIQWIVDDNGNDNRDISSSSFGSWIFPQYLDAMNLWHLIIGLMNYVLLRSLTSKNKQRIIIYYLLKIKPLLTAWSSHNHAFLYIKIKDCESSHILPLWKVWKEHFER